MDHVNLAERLITQAKKAAELIKDEISSQFYDKLCSTITMSQNYMEGETDLSWIDVYDGDGTGTQNFIISGNCHACSERSADGSFGRADGVLKNYFSIDSERREMKEEKRSNLQTILIESKSRD